MFVDSARPGKEESNVRNNPQSLPVSLTVGSLNFSLRTM